MARRSTRHMASGGESTSTWKVGGAPDCLIRYLVSLTNSGVTPTVVDAFSLCGIQYLTLEVPERIFHAIPMPTSKSVTVL